MSVLTVASLIVTTLPASSAVLSGAEQTTLGRPSQLTAAALGEDTMDGLQYADPKASLDLISPPDADSQGGAKLDHPLSVPVGRAGVGPTLELSYDSAGGNGWVGTGWDLSLGAVEIDTRWGAPLFCPAGGALCGAEGSRNVESETYTLDGDQLAPTAVRFPFATRVADRSDWTRRVETHWERIVRHGDSPKNYWWEVTSKTGTVRYYGGTPEGARDPQAILSDSDGNAVRWGLSGVRDISNNIMRISYDKPAGHSVGAEGIDLGTGFYLRSIRYTGSLTAGVPDDPAYQITFLRDSDLSSVPQRRPDVIVDASAGVLQVTSDLLRRVEVRYGSPVSGGGARTYDQLVKAWNLVYTTGAFGKSLLEKVEQVGSDNAVTASHTFTYYDEVRDNSGGYDGFAAPTTVNTGTNGGNDINQRLLGPVGLSALGASETNSGDVHAYIGFNPTDPQKTGSFGGSLAISGGGTGALVEMMDINGDLLPDKVFRTNITSSGVSYRLNNGLGGFGEARPIGSLNTLSTEANIGISGGPEAYFGVSAQFNIAADVTIGEKYFTDVNNDGLPDFVNAGKVYFNTPTPNGPDFRDSSAGTPVPIDDGSLDLGSIQELADFEQQQRDSSPLQDVVRRWVAPFTGTVTVSGAVTLSPDYLNLSPSWSSGSSTYTGDGVRVAVQYRGNELWSARLTTPGESTTPSNVSTVNVEKGKALYFRVGSVDDGAKDLVQWDPVVTYTSLGSPATDANGLSQTVYDSSAEFTLAGRPDTPVLMPLRGTVRVEGTLTKAKTSDEITVLVLHNGVAVLSQRVSADATAPITISKDFTVAAPTDTGADSVVVRIVADSPIDPTAVSFTPQLYYTQAFDGSTEVPVTGDVDNDGVQEPTLKLDVPYDIDVYPHNDVSAPVAAWTSDLDRTVTVRAAITASGAEAGSAVLTVKQSAGSGQPGTVIAKKTFSTAALGGAGQIDVALHANTAYWFDLTVRDPDVSDKITGNNVTLTWTENGEDKTRDVPETLNWAGRQGVFPIAHRGWAYAGYNAQYNGTDRSTVALDEASFEFNQSDFPTREPTGFDDTSYQDPAQGKAYAFTPYVLDVKNAQGTVTGQEPMWRGAKDNLAGGDDFIASSRTGSDSIGVTGGTNAGSGVRAVRRVGVSAPMLGVVAGIGPLTGAFAAGPSFGLLDYLDLNGDSFPDVVAPGKITYTSPRGGFLPGSGDGPAVVGQDTTFAVSGGFSGTAIDVKGNSKGDANTAQETSSTSGTGKKPTNAGSARQGVSAEEQEAGANVGGSFGITAQFTNPGSSSADWNDGLSKTKLDTNAPLERELADVNGDGLPDKVVASLNGVSVYFNLGYRFSTTAVKWGGGAFENGESYSGSVGPLLGFNYNKKEFSGGLSYSEAIDMPRYAWEDIDGDGVLDRVHKTGGTTKVAFGSGSGLADEIDYGDMVEGEFELAGADIPTGQQAAQDRSRGFGGGFDFTIPIGPLCIAACYLIINPGASYERSLSSSQVQLTDVNGDGYPDSVKSTEDGQMTVRVNKRGRTNLLQSVTNPLGGEIRLSYTYDGNTVKQPYPIWTMSGVEVDDNRPGDGPDVQATTYTYTGNQFDLVERQALGYSRVVEEQRAGALGGNVLRKTVHTYLNNSVFDSGLETRTEMQAPDGKPLSRTDSTWRLTNLATGEADPVPQSRTGAQSLALLDDTRGQVRTNVVQSWYDAGGNLGTSQESRFDYDTLGNVVRQIDNGQPGTAEDDLVAETTYSDCRSSSWVSVPATFTVNNGTSVLRHRDGSTGLCQNGVPTHLEERIDDATKAVTDMTLDQWGNYKQIAYPQNATGQRYTVDYVYDADRHTDIASVTDSHGLTATASYSPEGQVLERVDANGNATRYTYDAFDRLSSVRGPYEQGPDDPATVTYEYHPDAPYAYAIARHHDRFNPGDTINTVTFVDGIGRVTQTKHDATIVASEASSPATDKVLVSGAVEFDGLGRKVKEWFPSVEALGSLGTFSTSKADYYPPTETSYNLRDQVAEVSEPDGDTGEDPHVTTLDYSFGTTAGLPAGMFVTTTTDAVRHDDPGAGKQQVTYTDVRGNVRVVDDIPAGDNPSVRTRYAYDPLGQLTQVTDNAGKVTTHTYDGLGRRLSTATPDGGLREQAWDAAGNLVSETTPNLRASNTAISYSYDVDRLTRIDYPDATPDVSYTYGAPGAPGNGAGRVVALEDGARIQSLGYDPLGNVANETTTMKTHELNPDTKAKLTYKTTFSYDSFGRLDKLTYPDGEVLSHEYDSGGLLSGLQGAKACSQLGRLVGAIDAVQTTLTVQEVPVTPPPLPFTIRIDGEQMRVTARTATGKPGEYAYTVERGINGTPETPTAKSHSAGSKVIPDVPATCIYRYLDRQEYDEFLSRRLRQTGNGVLTQWGFDWIGRLQTVVTDTPERQVQNLTYTYDKADNVLSMDNAVPPAVSSLYGGPSSQSYVYDPYYRLLSAGGSAELAPDKVRTFTWSVKYDANGNVTSKTQTDLIGKPGSKRQLIQKATTYTFDNMQYTGDGPHQLTKNGKRTYTYDSNGNMTRWVDAGTKETRVVTYDAEDRVTLIDDGNPDTSYVYDADGRRAIERGPDGETSFVNRWYTVRQGSVPWKNIWAGDDRLATKRVLDKDYETEQYYLHKDLQGSTNIVTDDTGKVFEHWEYLPGGEPWIREDSNVHRTPYLYAGGYTDEVRNLLDLGRRWFEPREGLFYTPDPTLSSDPTAVVDDPALLPAYSYAESSPLRLVDRVGDRPLAAGTDLQARGIDASGGPIVGKGVAAAFAAAEPARSSRMWSFHFGLVKSESNSKLQAFSDRFEMKPLVQVNLTKTANGWGVDNVKVSPFGFVEATFTNGAADRVGAAGANPAPDAGLGGQPAPQPGAGTAAVQAGPAAVAAGGAQPDTGAAAAGTGVSATATVPAPLPPANAAVAAAPPLPAAGGPDAAAGPAAPVAPPPSATSPVGKVEGPPASSAN